MNITQETLNDIKIGDLVYHREEFYCYVLEIKGENLIVEKMSTKEYREVKRYELLTYDQVLENHYKSARKLLR